MSIFRKIRERIQDNKWHAVKSYNKSIKTLKSGGGDDDAGNPLFLGCIHGTLQSNNSSFCQFNVHNRYYEA